MLDNLVISRLDSIISKWPAVKRHMSPSGTQIVFSVGGTNFCWLSPGIGMVQLWPSLGAKSQTRQLRRVGEKTLIVRQRTRTVDALYVDPRQCLRERWSYPGFMCSGVSLQEAESLVRQAYNSVGNSIDLSSFVAPLTQEMVAPVLEWDKPPKIQPEQIVSVSILSPDPHKDLLVNLYHDLRKSHRKDLLPLESDLPCELQYSSRDRYRTIMTMILSERSDDLKLSRALGRLFRLYPDLADLRGWSKRQIIDRILVRKDKGGCGFGGYGKPHGGGNEDRLYSFMDLYFNTWEQKITEQNIDDLETLPPGSGFGPKFTRTLRAYCFGNSRVLPLDTPGFEFLKRRYPPCAKSTIDEVRNHIEEMLSSEESVSLIDFHELLRFRGQTDGKPINGTEYENIVVGWNAWRLLCSNKRTEITEDWICARLITGREDLAKKLWRFFKEITAL